MPLGHVSLPTGPGNFKAMRAFYVNTLSPLGYKVFEEKDGVYLGLMHTHMNPDFWLHCGGDDLVEVDPRLTADENRKVLGARTHVAFNVASKRIVDEWYRNALKAGGIPNGEPGERPEYVKGYYAAFVLDPLGNNIEVVCFNPWWLKAMKAVPSVLTMLAGAVAAQVAMGYAKRAGWA
ncbi:hypothetical protein VTI74DRAFT_11141 [Chaetomium olivicolor]